MSRLQHHRTIAITITLCAAFGLPAASIAGTSTASAAFEVDQLSTDTPDWKLGQLSWSYAQDRWKAGGGYTDQERFGLKDQQLHLEGQIRPTENWTLVGRQTFSDTAQVLPNWSSGVDIYRSWAPWVFIASMRYSEYRADSTQLWRLGAERYFGRWVPGYTLSYGVLEGAAAGYSHQLKLDYFLTDKRWFGIGLIQGDEATRIGINRAVLARVQGAYAKLHWGINTQWSANLVVSHIQQGDFYHRNGIRFGLDYRY